MMHNAPFISMNYVLLLWIILMILIMTHYSYLMKIQSKLKVHMMLSFSHIRVELILTQGPEVLYRDLSL